MENFYTVTAALVLAAFAGITGFYGTTVDEDDYDSGFYKYIMVVVAIASLWTAWSLSYPERHMDFLKQIAENAELYVLLVVLAKGLLSYVMMGSRPRFNDLVEVVGICALMGSVGTKAKEITTTGAQPDLHAANIWLAIIGYICLLALVVMGTFKHRRTVALSVNAVRQGQMPAPATTQQPAPPTASPDLKKHL